MICRECRSVFDADDGCAVFDRVPYGEEDLLLSSGSVCPHCGSESVEDERTCMLCDQEYSRSELDNGLCRICVEETTESLSWLWNSLTPAQRAWACEHTEWMDA